jgi:hypothetical protein
MYRRDVRLGIILVLVLLGITGVVPKLTPLSAGGGKPPVTLSLLPSVQSRQPDEVFTVNVFLDMVADSHDISIVTIVLTFDPTVIEATAFEPNTSELPQLQVIERTPIGPGIGTIGLTIAIGANPTAAIRASATLAIVTFRAVGPNGSSTTINWARAQALSLSPWDTATENVVGSTNNARVCIGMCGSPDATATPSETPLSTRTPTATPTIVPTITLTPHSVPSGYYIHLPFVANR